MPIPPFSNAPSTGASTSTANNWTANQTFSGTNNTAPAQTAASGSSLMTKDLVAARLVYSNITANTVVVTNSTTLTDSGLSLSLGVGTWAIDYYYNCLSSAFLTAGSRSQYVFTGTATELSGYAQIASTSAANTDFQTTYTNGASSLGLLLNGGLLATYTNSSHRLIGKSIINVTSSGLLKAQMAQTTAVPLATVSIGKGSQLLATQLI